MNIDKKRIKIIFFIFMLGFISIFLKAFIIQVIKRENLLVKAKKQFFREKKVYPRRGHIYDRNKNPLAINIRTYSIFAIPKKIKSDDAFVRLKKIIPNINSTKIKMNIKKRNKFTWIMRKISLSQEQYNDLSKIDGIYAEEITKRFYPNHELASQVLGFVGVDNIGLSGIEYQFDRLLRGKSRVFKYIVDNKGRSIDFTKINEISRAKDIYLSIDKEIQAVAEKALKGAVEEFDAQQGGVGIINSETGEIIAMANYPTFDPNDLSKSKSIHRKLSFISDPFEPGSTFKLLTIASALEKKIVRPETNYYCEKGFLKVGNHIISEAESQKKYEWLSVSDIVRYSSNVGVTKIAFDLTFSKLRDTLLKFNIGDKTEIEIPGESRGIFTDKLDISPLSLSNISFGQGVATTGIQMLVAYAAIANGGYYIKPTILKRSEKEKIKKERILSEGTASELTQMLIDTVETGTASNGKIKYFKIAAKTSTAQRSNGRGQYDGYIPGFIGFPVNVDKKFVVYVYIDNPQKGYSYYGNNVAGPVFKKITEYLVYKNKEFKKLAQNKNYKNDMAFESVRKKKIERRNLGEDYIPNFLGLDKKSSSKLGNDLDLDLEHRGIGVVTDQLPKAGKLKEKNMIIVLKYLLPKYE